MAPLWYGLLALVVGWIATVVWRHRGRVDPLPIAGILLSGASVLGMREVTPLPTGLLWGLLLLALAGVVAERSGAPTVTGMVLAVPGAGLVAAAEPAASPWLQVATGAAIVLTGALTADLDRVWSHRGYGPVLLGVSALGIYLAVPDTEHAVILMAVALPLTLLGWPLPQASLGPGGAFAATGLLVWTVTTGAGGSNAAVSGGIGCLGLFVVEPVARRRARGRSPFDVLELRLPSWAGPMVVAGAQLGLVAVSARVVATRHHTTGTVVTLGLAFGLAVAAAIGMVQARRS